MEELIIIKETDGWINVLDYGVCNNEKEDVSSRVQEIINAAPEDSIIYFPRGKYLFTNGIEINKRLTLCGDAYFRSNNPNNPYFHSGATQFSCKFDNKKVEEDTIQSFAVITVKGVKHCIKSISFQSDSCYRPTKIQDDTSNPPANGEPGFHHKIIFLHEGKYISGIVCDNVAEGSGHYENLDFGGFAETALKMPNNSTANDITIFTCNRGISAGENSIITNGKTWGCTYGMEISTGTFLSNMRVEEVGKVGIKNIGKGSNFITNATIDQCGYCGFQFDSISQCRIVAKITRCGQYYFNFSYEDYLKLDDKDRIEEAYSLFYGNSMESSYIMLPNDNGDNWEDFKEDRHKVYFMKACETKNVSLKGNIDATDMVLKSEKGNLIYNNKEQTVIFYNGKICNVNGIDISEEDYGDKIKIEKDDMYINGNMKMYSPQINDIISTTIRNINSVEGQYQVKLEKINEKVEFGKTIHDYKVIAK
ncbi:glycosyl hydrolase family 28-related protein [Clostridioides difficile]